MPKIKSVVGATGLMQVMPETGSWVAQKINLKKYSLEDPNDNVKLGTWYLDRTHDEYQNNSLLAVASYNAGPNAVADWLKRFSFNDPDEFVNKIPFPETNGYVKSVFENYWNYLRIYNPEVNQLMAEHYEAAQKKAKP
jgi:soluble lytic murein transglycosylase